MGSTFTGLSGKTKSDFGHGDGRFVTYMNVFLNPVSDLTKIEAIEVDEKQNEVRYGDVFFTTSSETPEEVGMSSVWLGNTENIYLNSFCFGYRLTDRIAPYYMAYMLRSAVVRKKIVYLAQGISRYNISKNKMMEIDVPLPSYPEQEAIGTFFRQLDELLTLHQRKLIF
ncbi:restriction endonuclease subunit S [Streptococcus ratti]|nr:restriction endonuclease subunit S [Streptococcus ratti]